MSWWRRKPNECTCRFISILLKYEYVYVYVQRLRLIDWLIDWLTSMESPRDMHCIAGRMTPGLRYQRLHSSVELIRRKNTAALTATWRVTVWVRGEKNSVLACINTQLIARLGFFFLVVVVGRIRCVLFTKSSFEIQQGPEKASKICYYSWRSTEFAWRDLSRPICTVFNGKKVVMSKHVLTVRVELVNGQPRCIVLFQNLADPPTSGYLDYAIVRLGEENKVDLAFQLFSTVMDHQMGRAKEEENKREPLPIEVRLSELPARHSPSSAFNG